MSWGGLPGSIAALAGRRARAVAAAVALLSPLALAGPSPAQEPLPGGWHDLTAARLAPRELADAARDRVDGAVWFGYGFEARPGVHVGCQPGGRGSWIHFSDGDGIAIDRDGVHLGDAACDDRFGLFLRLAAGEARVDEVRLTSFHRAAELDEPVVWGGQVDAAASIGFLRTGVLESYRGRDDTVLSRSVAGLDVRQRKRLLLAAAIHRGDSGAALAIEALGADQPGELREEAVMLVASLGGDDAWRDVLAVARQDPDPEVREAAIFWLGQEAGEVAIASLSELATSDPDTEVRKSAVFALSQSDEDGAVDALIRIVREHDDPEVVRSALFWLGQSGDPRALDLFAEILLRRRG